MHPMQSTAHPIYQRWYPPSPRLRTALCLLLLSAVLWYPTVARAFFKDWTTVGSTGTVDEADRDSANFSGGMVTMKANATGTLNIRYNVVSVEGLFGGNGVELGVRFRDNGPAAHVVVRLKRFDLVNGSVETILTLDSNNFPASNGFQLRTADDRSLRFDFFDYAYFMDVALEKTNLSGTPALAIIQLASVEF